jgi:nucleotide-binding universal stress UspA family protein
MTFTNHRLGCRRVGKGAIMTSPTHSPYTIVLGFDFSPPAVIALEQALQLAANRPDVTLHALAVLDDAHGLAVLKGAKRPDAAVVDEVQRELRQEIDERLASADATSMLVFAHVRIGHAADELLRLGAEANADVLVVGTHGRRGMKRLVLGSVASEIVRKASVPVLVARPAIHDTANVGDEPEAVCPACAAARAESGGATWWCDAHNRPYEPPHRYDYHPAISAQPHRHDVPRS